MTAANYQPFVERMISKYEGGYCWDAADPGGPTKYGITYIDLAEHRGQPQGSAAQWAPVVKAMPLSEADDIYAQKYARKDRFDELNSGADTVIFDYGVNSGTARPIRVAQALLNQPQTGKFDDGLLKAINAAEPAWFINSMCNERLHFMHQIRGGAAWQTFGGGWGKRVADLHSYSLHLSENKPAVTAPTPPDLSNVPTPKAQHAPDPNIVKKAATGAGGSGTVAAGSAYVAGFHWEYLVAIGAAVIIGGVIYIVVHHRNVAKANAAVILPPGVTPRG